MTMDATDAALCIAGIVIIDGILRWTLSGNLFRTHSGA